MNESIMKQINLKAIKSKTPIVITVADGRQVSLQYKVSVKTTYNNKTYRCNFYVVKDLPLSIILGTDSLFHLGPRIDTPDVTVYIKKPLQLKSNFASVPPIAIRLKPGASPRFRARYRLSKTEEEIAEKMIKDMIKKGIVSPTYSESNSALIIAN